MGHYASEMDGSPGPNHHATRPLEPGDVVTIDGRDRTVKIVRGRYVEFTDGTEIGFVHQIYVPR